MNVSDFRYILLSKTIIFFNCAINPVLYNAMSARFVQRYNRLSISLVCTDFVTHFANSSKVNRN